MPPPLVAVCSEIGRGHPQYLDSVLEALCALGISDVPRVVPRWRLARAGYRLGAAGGPLTALYNRARGRAPSRLLLRLLDAGLRRRFRDYPGLLLVDHPLLAHLLGPVCRVGYVHGEIAAPPNAAVPSAWRSFVPLAETADALAGFGVPREALAVTGLIIEPGLVPGARAAGAARLERLASGRPLRVGFFTSGACPRPHLRAILQAAGSCLAAAMGATLFCGTDPRVGARLRDRLGTPAGLTLVSARTRAEETARTVELLPDLDLAVAAAHERTGWACGLGLPLFALLPHVGPFARENAARAATRDVCLPLAEPAGLAGLLARLRASGRLAAMARAGLGRHPVAGAEAAARLLLAAR